MHSAHRLKEGAAFVDDHRVDVVPVTEARWEFEIVGRLRGEGGDGTHNSRGQQAQPSAPLDPRPPSDRVTARNVSSRLSATREPCAHPEFHFTAENAAGASNWLLMFSTSWPSFSVLATTATHSRSARKAPQPLPRPATLFPEPQNVVRLPPVPPSGVPNPAVRPARLPP